MFDSRYKAVQTFRKHLPLKQNLPITLRRSFQIRKIPNNRANTKQLPKPKTKQSYFIN